MNMKKGKYLIGVGLLCVMHLQAQDSKREDEYAFGLEECIEYAVKNNASIQNAYLDEKLAKYKVKETYGIGLPQISGSFDFKDYLTVAKSLLPAGSFNNPTTMAVQFGVPYNATLGVSASQLLFNSTYLVGLQAAQTYQELSSKNVQRNAIETKVAVQKTYYSVLVSNERFKLLEANIHRLRKTLEEMEVMHKNGLIEQIDLDRIRVLSNNLDNEYRNVARLLEVNVALLKFQMGMPLEVHLKVVGNIETMPIESLDLEENPYQYKDRIEFSLLQTQKKLNELDIKRHKASYLPSLLAYAGSNLAYMGSSFSDVFKSADYMTSMGASASYPFPINVIGFTLSVPIFDSGQKYFRIQQAKLSLMKTQNDISNFKNAVGLDIQQSKAMYKNSLESLNNQKRNRTLATEVLRVSKIKYEQGVGSSLEVTTAETSLKEAETNYIGALYDVLISKVNYLKATGKLN